MKVGDIVVIDVDAPKGTDGLSGFLGETGMIAEIAPDGDCWVVTADPDTTYFWFSQEELRLASDLECRETLTQIFKGM